MSHPRNLPDVLDQLSHLLATASLPAKTQASCEALFERLQAPVRIGLMGMPGVGKRRVLNALIGTAIVPEDVAVPTLEVVLDRADAITAVLEDGATLSAASHNMQDLLDRRPVFLSLSNPICSSRNLEYLLVVTDEDRHDATNGLLWAVERVDVALWCSRQWTATEAQVWATAPHRLKDHSVLCFTGPKVRLASHPADFESVLYLSSEPTVAARQLSDTLDTLISDALSQDMLFAEYLFERFGAEKTVAITPSQPALPEEPVSSQVPPDAHAELARLFRQFRRAAADMRQSLQTHQIDESGMLGRIATLFEDMVEQADDGELIPEFWPDLHHQLVQARDLALLLRLEGGTVQTTDAARLMLQLRGDLETQLAA